MMLSPVKQGTGGKTGMRHINTHVVMRRTRSAFAKVGRSVTPAIVSAKSVPDLRPGRCMALAGRLQGARRGVAQAVFLSYSLLTH